MFSKKTFDIIDTGNPFKGLSRRIPRSVLKLVLMPAVFILAVFLCGPSPASAAGEIVKPLASDGYMDLSRWKWETQGPVALKGQWIMYRNVLLEPPDFKESRPEQQGLAYRMPAVWNGYKIDGERLKGMGCATYRLKVRLKPGMGMMAFHIPRIFTAYRLWVDDQLVAEAGKTGPDRASMEPQFKSPVAVFQPQSDQVAITLQISNFFHSRGGIRQTIKIGDKEQIDWLRSYHLVLDSVLIGALLIISLYHLALFALRRKDAFNIYFSLICLLFLFRTAFTSETVGQWVFRDVDWQLATKLEWLSVYIAPALAIGFFQSYFPQDGSKRIKQTALCLGGLGGLMVFLSSPLFFTSIFHFMTPLIFLMLVYCVYILVKALIRRRQGAGVIAVAYTVTFAATANDLLHASEVVKTGFYLSYSLLFFIITQSVQLSVRSSKAMRRVEEQAEELALANQAYEDEIQERKRAEKAVKAYQEKLEELVAERTTELEVANQRLREELADRLKAENEKERLQLKLQRAHKMEAVGTLAGGVAHDLNNILSGLVSYPELLLMDLPPESKMRPAIETILKSGQKTAAIVQDLLTLARRGIQTLEVVNLNTVIKDYLDSPEFQKMLQFHDRVSIDMDLDPSLMNVEGSTIHLSKTVINLVSNAAEALPEGGAIRLATRNRYVDRPLEGYEITEPGDYAVMEISDDGVGMEQDEIDRIFEPFYSKKKMGRSGTGLGMAVVWGTVKDHNGYINIKSQHGKGTILTLYFPITRELQPEPAASSDLQSYRGKGETVLIVDDVREQREIARSMLQKLGYRTVSASCGEEAVAYVSKQKVDLLLLDMIMAPGIDGMETYRRICAVVPGQKAVIASGYSETDRVRKAQALGAGGYLRKPYTLINVARAIRRELDH